MSIFDRLNPTIFSLLVLFIFLPHAQSVGICPAFSCNSHHRHHRDYFTIHFPFRVPRNQSSRCGYPRFDLSCSSDGETILRLPSNSKSNSSELFIVREIDYGDQILWVSDPKDCIPKRVLKLNLTGTPFEPGPDSTEYTFLNCSGHVDTNQLPVGTAVIRCLSEQGFTVVATFEKESEEKMVKEGKCEVIKRVVAPLWWPGFVYGLYPMDMSDVVLQLSWDLPGCGDCVVRGGNCGFVHDSGLDVGCFISGGNGGLPRSARYGLILGTGIPALFLMISLMYYLCQSSNSQTVSAVNAEAAPAVALAPAPQPINLALGLDVPTLNSCPLTVIGESERLPRPSDGNCCICLEEYVAKETLRTIPQCSHNFHAKCLDNWFRENITCPICRTSPRLPPENEQP